MSFSGMGGKITTPLSSRWGGRMFKSIKKKEPLSEESTFEVNLLDGEIMKVDLFCLRKNAKCGEILIQDVVKDVCKRKEIAPNSVGFFGIRCENANGLSMWMIQTKTVADIKIEKKKKFYFRLQFKVVNGSDLKKRDLNAYKYYLKQCRFDFKSGLFAKELEGGRENEKILLRMVILEMKMQYEELQNEEKLNQLKDILKPKYRKHFNMDDILKKYDRRDLPRDLGKCKHDVEKSLKYFAKVEEPDKQFITEIEILKNYREDVFNLQKYERGGNEANNVELWVSPSCVQKKVLMANMRTVIWESEYAHMHRIDFCETDEKKGIKLMIARGEGDNYEPPEVMYCASEEVFESLCSTIDGYYRLLYSQYNSLLYESCEDLSWNPYFGPIERDAAVRILLSKGFGRGTYLIREHTKYYGNFTLSMISNEDQVQHIEIIQEKDDGQKSYSFKGGSNHFASIENLTEYYTEPQNSEKLGGCLLKMIQPKQAGNVPLFIDPDTFRPFIDRQNLVIQNQPVQQHRNQVVFLGPSDIIGEEEIKEGVFGKVCKASSGGEELLIRHFKDLKCDDILNLLEILKSVRHENLISLFGISISPGNIFLAEEYLQQGSLDKHLQEHRNDVTYGELLNYSNQIAVAMLFLHTKECVHADLSLNHVYLHHRNTIKIGNACTKWKLSSHENLSAAIFKEKICHHAPEIILSGNKSFTKESDVWAFGLTIWQLFSLEKPFKNLDYQFKDFLKQHMVPKDTNQSILVQLNMFNLSNPNDLMLEIINGCLHFLPDKRFSMEEVMNRMNKNHFKVPTQDKQQRYFISDWSKPHNGHGTIPSGDEYTDSSSLFDGQLTTKLNELNPNDVKSEEKDMEMITEPPLLIKQGNNFGGKLMNGASHSAPCSPNRPKLHRTNSLNDVHNHDDEEFEAASIMVDMSQNCPQEDNANRTNSVTEKISDASSYLQLDCSHDTKNPSSIKKAECTSIGVNIKPEAMNNMGSIFTKSLVASTMEESSKPILVPQSPPPDSPEAVRREFPSDYSKKDFPKDDKTRLYIKDRINKERDRYHGKRSLSFTEEFDEYKNNTIRAAKRALLGTNPFNLGVQLPDNFLLRTDKRICQKVPKLPPDIIRYFKNVEVSKLDTSFPYQDTKIHGKNSLETYVIKRELDNYPQTSNMKSDPNDIQGDQVQLLMKGMEQMHAHSPSPIICDTDKVKCENMRHSSLGIYGSQAEFQSLTNSNVSNFFPYNQQVLHTSSQANKLLSGTQATLSPMINSAQIRTHTIPLVSVRPTQAQIRTQNITVLNAQPSETQIRTQTNSQLNTHSMQSQIRTQIFPLLSSQPSQSPVKSQTNPLISSQSKLLPIRSPNISIVVTQPTQSPIKSSTISLVSTQPTQQITAPKMVNFISAYPDIRYPTNQPAQMQAHISGQALQLQYFSFNPHSISPRTVAIPPQQLISTAVQPQLALSHPVSDSKNSKESPLQIRKSVSSPPSTQPTNDVLSQKKTTTHSDFDTAYGSVNEFMKPAFDNDSNVTSEYKVISKSDLKLSAVIGKGAFGEVRKGEWNYKKNGTTYRIPVAVKRLVSIAGKPVPKETIEEMEREARHLSSFSNDKNSASQHIIKLYGVCKDSDTEFQIVQQLAVHGRIDHYISSKKEILCEGDLLYFCKQVAVGMDYLHSKNVIHRDIACRNILVCDRDMIKISDFGLSRQGTENYYQKSKSKVPLFWLALECIEYAKYTKESDSWSFGVAAWEMFTVFQKDYMKKDVSPYEGIDQKELCMHLKHGNRLSKPLTCPLDAWENIQKCWNEDLTKRPCFKELITVLNKCMKNLNYTT